MDEEVQENPASENTISNSRYSRFVTQPLETVWHGVQSTWGWLRSWFTGTPPISEQAPAAPAPLSGYSAAVGGMALRFLVDVIGVTVFSALAKEENASAIAGTAFAYLFLISVPSNMLIYRFQPLLAEGYRQGNLLKPYLTTVAAVSYLAIMNALLLLPTRNFVGAVNSHEEIIDGASALVSQYMLSGGTLFFLTNALGVVVSSSTESSHFDFIANGIRVVTSCGLMPWYLMEEGEGAVRAFASSFALGGLLAPSLVHFFLLLKKHRHLLTLPTGASWRQTIAESMVEGWQMIGRALPYAGSALTEAAAFAILFNFIASKEGITALQALNGYGTFRVLAAIPFGLAGQYKANLAVYWAKKQRDPQSAQRTVQAYQRMTALLTALVGVFGIGVAPYLKQLFGGQSADYDRGWMAIWSVGVTFEALRYVSEGCLRGLDSSLVPMCINFASFSQFCLYSYLMIERGEGFKSFPIAYVISQSFAVLAMRYAISRKLQQIDTHPLEDLTSIEIVAIPAPVTPQREADEGDMPDREGPVSSGIRYSIV